MGKKLVLLLGIILSITLVGCSAKNVDMSLEESNKYLTEVTLQQIYPDAEIKSSYFFDEGKAAVVIYEQQGTYFIDTVKQDSLEPQRTWELVHPPMDIIVLDSETLCIMGIEVHPWTRERPATDLPRELLIKWKPESGFEHSYEQHWASAKQSHTYGYGNGDGIYAVLQEISAGENSIAFSFGPEAEQEKAFYAAIAREPQMMVSFDGQRGEVVLYDVKASLSDGVNGLTLGEDIHVQQDENNAHVSFTWQKSFQRYSLNTEWRNGFDPVVVLMFAE